MFCSNTAYAKSKDLATRIVSHQVFKSIVNEIVLNHNYGGYQRWLSSMVYKFFDKKTGSGGRMTRKTGVNVNKVLPPELLRQVLNSSKDEKRIRGLKIIVRLQI